MFIAEFKKNSILKKNMLDSLRENPQIFKNTLFSEMGEGIINGLDVEWQEGKFSVATGIVKYKNEILVIDNSINIDCPTTPETIKYAYLKKDEIESEDFSGKYINISIELSDIKNDDEFEIFRYSLGEGATLCKHGDFKEAANAGTIKDTGNRIDRTEVLYSVNGASTLLPFYFKLFARALLNKNSAKAADIAFSYQCLNGIQDIDIIKDFFKIDYLPSNKALINLMKSHIDNTAEGNIIPEEKISNQKTEKVMIIYN